jgi:hypothetical protein
MAQLDTSLATNRVAIIRSRTEEPVPFLKECVGVSRMLTWCHPCSSISIISSSALMGYLTWEFQRGWWALRSPIMMQHWGRIICTRDRGIVYSWEGGSFSLYMLRMYNGWDEGSPYFEDLDIGVLAHVWSGSDLEVGVAIGDIGGCAVSTASTVGGEEEEKVGVGGSIPGVLDICFLDQDDVCGFACCV